MKEGINHKHDTPLNVGLVNINNSFSGQNYFPYSVGCLQAYAEKNLSSKEEFRFCLPIYKRKPVASLVTELINVDIAFFSTYVWNIRLSLEVAHQLKKLQPHIMTIFGGPQVPDSKKQFRRVKTAELNSAELQRLHNSAELYIDTVELESKIDKNIINNPKSPLLNENPPNWFGSKRACYS